MGAQGLADPSTEPFLPYFSTREKSLDILGSSGDTEHARIKAYLVGIHEVHDQVQVPMDRLVFGQLRLHLVQPVHQGLKGVHELAGEEEGLFQLVLPAGREKAKEVLVPSQLAVSLLSTCLCVCVCWARLVH